MRRVCTGTPVHYEQTVRERAAGPDQEHHPAQLIGAGQSDHRRARRLKQPRDQGLTRLLSQLGI